MNEVYDLAIIGGGSAGLTAARLARRLDARVALLERHRIGGDCTWTGCVPSKTLIKIAKVAQEMRNAGSYGLPESNPQIDLKTVMAQVRKVTDEVYRDESPETLKEEGIDVFFGDAAFRDTHTLAVGENRLRPRRILITTGAHPFIPPVDGLENVDYLTYENIWDLETLPEHLMVVGAGPIGCELAQAFRRLGSGVSIIEAEQRISDDSLVAHSVLDVFTTEGISMYHDTTAIRAWQDSGGIHLATNNSEFTGDALLVAVGRLPNVQGLGLERAGVEYSVRGIQVDQHLRTSQHHIYAAGDCTGSYQFTHYAGWQSAIAVRNALLPGARKGVTDRVPMTIFTDPEVAQVGLTEEQARQKFGDRVLTCEWPMAKVDRARAEGETGGFLKIVYRRGGRLLGVTIMAARAGEMIHEWIVAVERGMKIGALADIIHVYPTYSTASMQAAADVLVSELLGGTMGRIARRLVRRAR
jgi:pyruvate/2-oxoglutarate dehydrogenase complex dihydrolipoamide dehydrogenase (E3) component